MSRALPSSMPGRRSTGFRLLREAGLEEVAAERFSVGGRADPRRTSSRSLSTFSNMRMRPSAEREQMLGADRRGGRRSSSTGAMRRTYQAVLYTGRKPGG